MAAYSDAPPNNCREGEGDTLVRLYPHVYQPYRIGRRPAYYAARNVYTNPRQHMTQLSVRISEELRDEFSEHCERHGETMSGKLKEFIRDEVGRGNHGPLPDEPELAKAYRKIWELRSDSNRVAVEEVESEVANVLNTPKKAVRRRVFQKLDDRGYINVKVGTITANVDIDPAEIATDATDSMEVPADD